MSSIAPTVAVAPQIPIEWITSGVITPVGSPAAQVATGWSPQPVVVDPFAGAATMRDAVLGSLPTPVPVAVQAQQQLPAVAPVVVADTSAPAEQLAQLAVTPPPTAASSDPTLVGSVSGALAGFASATGRVVGTAVEAVATATGSGVSKARRVGTELWAGVRSPRAVHVTQVPSKFNPNPAAGNRDCGPASVVMTLRLLGKRIPGIGANASPQQLINRVRQLAGSASNGVSTTNHDLERALAAAGARTTEIADGASIAAAVKGGRPVILNGNPRHPGAYGRSFSAAQMTPYDGAHWIVVSGFDTKSGRFIINDPLSKVGAVKVTPAQLEAYRGGSLGIAVDA